MREGKDKKLVLMAEAYVDDTENLLPEEITAYRSMGILPRKLRTVMLQLDRCSLIKDADPQWTIVLCEGQRMRVHVAFHILQAAKETESITINLSDILK